MHPIALAYTRIHASQLRRYHSINNERLKTEAEKAMNTINIKFSKLLPYGRAPKSMKIKSFVKYANALIQEYIFLSGKKKPWSQVLLKELQGQYQKQASSVTVLNDIFYGSVTKHFSRRLLGPILIFKIHTARLRIEKNQKPHRSVNLI